MRCVNIDWLELYCLEPADKYPMNADYYRAHGYFVREREYGTRLYREMFVIEDKEGNEFIEVRREPAAAQTQGLVRESCHLRMVNRHLYFKDPIGDFRKFLADNDLIYKRIYRIDICYDFVYFDSKDKPETFARRYVERKYRKVNQTHLRAEAEDEWADFRWETLSWGAPTSMVSTKMYNKTKELSSPKRDKPYIKACWFWHGLVDNPITLVKMVDGKETYPDVWRIEFSIHSKADGFIVIEKQGGKKVKKERIPHTLSMYDSPDKLWQRFQDLATNYFSFRRLEYRDRDKWADPNTPELKRKDLCEPKVLFHFNEDRTFYRMVQVGKAAKPSQPEQVLVKHLKLFKQTTADGKLLTAADNLIEALQKRDAMRYVPSFSNEEYEAMKLAVQYRMKHPDSSVSQVLEWVKIAMSGHDQLF